MQVSVKTGSYFRYRRNASRGFTIVELLIVIIVIAILATITIVAYNGIQNNARISSLTSDLDNVSRKLKLYQVDNASYPTAIDCSASPAANTICLQPSSGTTYGSLIANNSITPQGFCIAATNNGTTYFITQDGTPQSGSCSVTNLVTNPSLETNGTSFGYYWGSGSPAGTQARMATGGFSGSYFYRITWTASPSVVGGGAYYGSTSEVVTVGSTYTYSAYVRSSKSQLILGGIEWYNSVPSRISTSYTTGLLVSTGTWTRISVTGTAPAGTVWARLTLYAAGGTGGSIWNPGDYLDADAVMLTQSSILYTYADGSLTPQGWSWTGTPNASASTGPPL